MDPSSSQPRSSMESLSDRNLRKPDSHSPRSAHFPLRAGSGKDNPLPMNGRFTDKANQNSPQNGYLTSRRPLHELTPPRSPIERKETTRAETMEELRDEYELAAPIDDGTRLTPLENVSQLLFSKAHLKTIFADPSSLLKFTSFLSAHRPRSLPILIYYLDATKALKAIAYANAIAQSLEPIAGRVLSKISSKIINQELEEKAENAFNLLLQDDLPSYAAYLYIRVVRTGITRITATQQLDSQQPNDGYAEVFCLTDPSRPDNPIVFASEAFQRMTQYGMNYIVGRNCRFLQGPKSNPSSIQRLRESVSSGREHCELILNYRRDGSPFLNLLMNAPLFDHSGSLRYFIGSQIDVSTALDDSSELDSLRRVVMQSNGQSDGSEMQVDGEVEEKKDDFQQLIELLDMQELMAVRKWEDRMLNEENEKHTDAGKLKQRRPGMPLRDYSSELLKGGQVSGPKVPLSLSLYTYFLLVRPYPSLRILFASPSLDVPGVVQAPIMDKIGGSTRVRDELSQALADGTEVTARIRWMSNEHDQGQNRWIHFTPLIGSKGLIGVWMAILEDDDSTSAASRIKKPPPIRTKVASPIPEEPSDTEEDHRSTGVMNSRRHAIISPSPGHQSKVSWSGPEVAPELRKPSLVWSPEAPESPLSELAIDTMKNEVEEEYESLEERLKKKRQRDAALMLGQPVFSNRPTYKSLAPSILVDDET